MSTLTESGKELSKIGIGSYGVGGLGHRDMELTKQDDDAVYVDALVYNLEKGINFTEIALGYGHGKSLELFKQALDKSKVSRGDIFLTHSLYPRDLSDIEVIKEDITEFYEVMDTNYADSTLVTQGLIMQFGEDVTYQLLDELLTSGKSRFVSLSNASPTWVRKFKERFGDSFFAHEGHLSFEVREVADEGVFDTCTDLGVKNIIWRPLRQNRTIKHDWSLLVELSEKYGKTQSQVILNWICWLGHAPMVMSTSTEHIDENYASTEFEMSVEDYGRMNDFRPPNYHPPKVDWEGLRGGDDVVLLANNFEQNID